MIQSAGSQGRQYIAIKKRTKLRMHSSVNRDAVIKDTS